MQQVIQSATTHPLHQHNFASTLHPRQHISTLSSYHCRTHKAQPSHTSDLLSLLNPYNNVISFWFISLYSGLYPFLSLYISLFCNQTCKEINKDIVLGLPVFFSSSSSLFCFLLFFISFNTHQ
jgi:hypothetical protein